jgi:hypothetical protein
MPASARAVLVFLGACAAIPTRPARPLRPRLPRPPELLACLDLPRADERSHNLSGLAWDGALLYAVSDRDKALTVLRPSADLGAVAIEGTVPLEVATATWDGEAVARAGDRFYVASESPAEVFVTDLRGRQLGQVALPAHFARVRPNLGVESVGVTDDGRWLFVANEQALVGDGPVSDAGQGTTVRILRRDLATGAQREVAYRTEPVFADGPEANCGVSDVTPISAERALVVERGFVEGRGNSVQIYEVDVGAGEDVLGVDSLVGRRPVAKELRVDLATIAAGACSPPPGRQRNAALDNIEGLALGPPRADGRRVVFAITDDNDRADQLPRLLVLALDL